MSSPNASVSSASSSPSKQAQDYPFDPDFEFDSHNVIDRGTQIALDIKARPELFYQLWCSMRSLIAGLGGPDEAWRLFQKSPLGRTELPSHRARREGIREGAERVFYTSFDVEDLEALTQLHVAIYGSMPNPAPDSQVGLLGKLRDLVVETLHQLRAVVDMSGEKD